MVEPMKAITIYQPWASLLAIRAKLYETRGWATKYRGPIAIHAGMKELDVFAVSDEFLDAAADALNNPELLGLTYGAIIATAELVECWHMVAHPGTDIDVGSKIPIGAELDVPKKHPRFHDYIVPTEQELLFGDWTPGRYAWEFANMKLLDKPIPCRGKQGLWNWDGSVA